MRDSSGTKESFLWASSRSDKICAEPIPVPRLLMPLKKQPQSEHRPGFLPLQTFFGDHENPHRHHPPPPQSNHNELPSCRRLARNCLDYRRPSSCGVGCGRVRQEPLDFRYFRLQIPLCDCRNERYHPYSRLHQVQGRQCGGQ